MQRGAAALASLRADVVVIWLESPFIVRNGPKSLCERSKVTQIGLYRKPFRADYSRPRIHVARQSVSWRHRKEFFLEHPSNGLTDRLSAHFL